MTGVFLNLLMNSCCSLLAGVLLTAFFVWLLRVPNGPWKLFLLSLPLIKIVYDCARGVPADSILLRGVDPYMIPRGEQMILVGAGFGWLGPMLNAVFVVKDAAGQPLSASIGDYVQIWISHHAGHLAPLMLLVAAVVVAVSALGSRLVQTLRFERERRRDRRARETWKSVRLGWRTVDIYRTSRFEGSPFTGGLVKPYICLPEATFDALSEAELSAVVLHELGHVKKFDLPLTVLIQALGDVFWFVPGYRRLARKIDRLRELIADQSAVEAGAEPAQLASALLKIKEVHDGPCLAFFRERALLKTRIEALLGERKEHGRFGWQYRGLRWLFAAWITCAVMCATIGGNHETARSTNKVESKSAPGR